MGLTQKEIIAGILAGISLFFHLCSAGNFIPSSEIGLIGTLFSYTHSMCNLAARLCLLSLVAMISLEFYQPRVIFNSIGISYDKFADILQKLIVTALLTSAVRIILPGPVTYYSRVYKLSIILNTVASVLLTKNITGILPKSNQQKKNFQAVQNDNEFSKEMVQSNSDQTNIPSKRHRTAMELLQTETSYISNLKIIVQIYKVPLEKAVADGKPILASEDIRNIFGGIEEIADVHSDIHRDVSQIIDNWTEDCCVGEVIQKYKEKLIEVYPRYVNFFDMGQNLLLKRQESNPEFKAFLVECFPKSLKQNLEALMIRPVQRLPSLALLTSDLQKRTSTDLQDHAKLGEAKEALKQVLSHINEDKRKTESKTKIFDIVYEVTGCPPKVISSNRYFVKKIDVSTLNDGFYREKERLALYLLNDMLEIAKWRNRTHGNSLLKHVQLLSLHDVVSIMDLKDNNEQSIFAVRYFSDSGTNESNEERVSILQLLDDRTFKSGWLDAFASQVAEVKNVKKNEILKRVDCSELLNFAKRGTKIHKMLKSKSKSD